MYTIPPEYRTKGQPGCAFKVCCLKHELSGLRWTPQPHEVVQQNTQPVLFLDMKDVHLTPSCYNRDVCNEHATLPKTEQTMWFSVHTPWAF